MKRISEMYRISGGTDYTHLCNECRNLRIEKKKFICRLHQQAGGSGDWKPQFIACRLFNLTLPDIMKKMIKSAYKAGGLIVAHTPKDGTEPEGLYLAAITWAAWMEYDKVPKGIKAAVVEMTGELPETGKSYKAMPGMGNQVTMSDATVLDLREIVDHATERGRITKLVQTGPINIRYIEMENGDVLPISEELIKVIDKNATEKDESKPDGPCMKKDGYQMLWENERCIYLACMLEVI